MKCRGAHHSHRHENGRGYKRGVPGGSMGGRKMTGLSQSGVVVASVRRGTGIVGGDR